ncbi:unnamed protein product [Boreogadus saida]
MGAKGRRSSVVLSLPVLNLERLKAAKALAERAIKKGKVFSIQGPYPVVRADLRARGWVERRLTTPLQKAPSERGDEEGEGDEDGEEDRAEGPEGRLGAEEADREEEVGGMYNLMSRLVRNEAASLLWTMRRDAIDCKSLRKDQMTNHYANSGTFTTKVGLCVNLQNLLWFDTADPDSFFPRCYRLGAQDEKQAFLEDFRRTACSSLLQYVVESSCLDAGDRQEHTEYTETLKGGKRQCRRQARRFVDAGMIDSALHVCQEFLNSLEHGDIDVTVETFTSLTGEQWTEFLRDYYLVVHGGARIQGAVEFVERCRRMLSRLHEVCPQLDTDGLHNIWIVKPGAMSRGRGIMCMNRLEDILTLVHSDSNLIKDSKWVVQKYLERPLLVYGTKFDIRQWFLVTDWNPLTIWFYNECYLRFSTQPYSISSLDSSVHLCNNSIQKHLAPSRARHPGLPDDNMWSCSQFRDYLQDQGLGGSKWGALAVPGMQQAVVRAMRTAQDLVEPRRASFELYGADFMLGRDLRPWLLEINASPTMACSAVATARLCPAVQLDTLRVVLDWRGAPAADTGGFYLLYKQAAVEVPHYIGTNLLVEGAPLRPAPSRPAARKPPSWSNPLPPRASVEPSPPVVHKTPPTTVKTPGLRPPQAPTTDKPPVLRPPQAPTTDKPPVLRPPQAPTTDKPPVLRPPQAPTTDKPPVLRPPQAPTTVKPPSLRPPQAHATDKPPGLRPRPASRVRPGGTKRPSAGDVRTPLPSLSLKSRLHGRTLSGGPSGLGSRSHHRSAPERPAPLAPGGPGASRGPPEGPRARHPGLSQGQDRVALVPVTLLCSPGLPAHRPPHAPPLTLAGGEPLSPWTRSLQGEGRPHRRALPSLSGPLPDLEVFSLRPGSLSRERSALLSLQSLHRFKVCSRRRTLCRYQFTGVANH